MPKTVSKLDEADSFQVHELEREGLGPIVPLMREVDGFNRESIRRSLREICGGETTCQAVLEFVLYLSKELADAKEFLRERNLSITFVTRR